jgi:hypothetical protein
VGGFLNHLAELSTIHFITFCSISNPFEANLKPKNKANNAINEAAMIK